MTSDSFYQLYERKRLLDKIEVHRFDLVGADSGVRVPACQDDRQAGIIGLDLLRELYPVPVGEKDIRDKKADIFPVLLVLFTRRHNIRACDNMVVP